MIEVTLQMANKLIEEIILKAREKGMPPIAAVLDSGAHLKAFQREDDISFLRVHICQAKAWRALGMASNSNTFADRYNQDDQQRGFVNAMNAMTGGQLIPLPGDDEVCALAGIAAIDLYA